LVSAGQDRSGPFVLLGGDTGRFISYATPRMMGFQLAGSIGRPQDLHFGRGENWFQEQNGGDFKDIALRYKGDWNDFKIAAGIGAWSRTTEEKGALEPVRDTGWGGSFAVLHKPTGLNIAFNYGDEGHTRTCLDPGAVTSRCRGNDKFYYVKGGILRDFFDWGPTAFYGEYFRSWKALHDSDESALRTLELNPGEAGELTRSVAQIWGLGAVQTIKPSKDRPYTTDLYIGYRHHELDLRLINNAGGPAAAARVNDFDVVMAGVRFRWGEHFKRDGDDD
jgi:hypothetical protein